MLVRLLLLCASLTSSTALLAADQVDQHLPRSGQIVELFSADLSTRIDRLKPEVDRAASLYTLSSHSLPTLYFMLGEQKFSIPGVAVTGKAERFDQKGSMRWVFRGSNQAGAIEKGAYIELVKFNEGRCQLSWKLSVINRSQKVRDQQGAIAYDCLDQQQQNSLRRVQRFMPDALLDR
jgi:hypothetical protein